MHNKANRKAKKDTTMVSKAQASTTQLVALRKSIEQNYATQIKAKLRKVGKHSQETPTKLQIT